MRETSVRQKTITVDLRGKWLKKWANMDLGDWNTCTGKFKKLQSESLKDGFGEHVIWGMGKIQRMILSVNRANIHFT